MLPNVETCEKVKLTQKENSGQYYESAN